MQAANDMAYVACPPDRQRSNSRYRQEAPDPYQRNFQQAPNFGPPSAADLQFTPHAGATPFVANEGRHNLSTHYQPSNRSAAGKARVKPETSRDNTPQFPPRNFQPNSQAPRDSVSPELNSRADRQREFEAATTSRRPRVRDTAASLDSRLVDMAQQIADMREVVAKFSAAAEAAEHNDEMAARVSHLEEELQAMRESALGRKRPTQQSAQQPRSTNSRKIPLAHDGYQGMGSGATRSESRPYASSRNLRQIFGPTADAMDTDHLQNGEYMSSAHTQNANGRDEMDEHGNSAHNQNANGRAELDENSPIYE